MNVKRRIKPIKNLNKFRNYKSCYKGFTYRGWRLKDREIALHESSTKSGIIVCFCTPYGDDKKDGYGYVKKEWKVSNEQEAVEIINKHCIGRNKYLAIKYNLSFNRIERC